MKPSKGPIKKVTSSDIVFTLHAKKVLGERNIFVEWVLLVLNSPQKTQPDLEDPELTHVLSPIAENGNRVLRVVYNNHVKPVRIVTTYFDRTVKGKL